MNTSLQEAAKPESKGHGPPTITVKVFVQGSTEPKKYTWPQSTKVGEAADQVAADCGFPPNPSFTFQANSGELLDRKKPLVAAGVRDCDELQLVSIGGGV